LTKFSFSVKVLQQLLSSKMAAIATQSVSNLDLNSDSTKTLQRSGEVIYEQYQGEQQLPQITQLIAKDLSEPYNIYTYRYFLHCWPELSWLALDSNTKEIVGVVINKIEDFNQQKSEENPENIESGEIEENEVKKTSENSDTDQKNDSEVPEKTKITDIVNSVQESHMMPMFETIKRGYIAMLAIHADYRRKGMATKLVSKSIETMQKQHGAEQVMLETEVTNRSALGLYDRLGFMREERLYRYYLNGVDAYRLTLYLK